ncbi:uncharacterized protein LOC122653631 isoform X2 [Telopea speciosissima]|uniref:uncharacterized protein LOC122653631 isoform X2 n=1 Tax=Telopea speciosissima TaxID=54955 RepID=UPI001CC58A55|nr:uncharacterized protein LOC122653631 isoform X2 [Telopea speciosissima]
MKLEGKGLNTAAGLGCQGSIVCPPADNPQAGDEGGMQIVCFTENFRGVTLHFQIIRLKKRIYAWIGCHTANFGRLYAAAPAQRNHTVTVASVLGGASDNMGSSIAQRLDP